MTTRSILHFTIRAEEAKSPRLAAICAVLAVATPSLAAAAAVPDRAWGTYVGGDKFDSINALALDATGHVFACGGSHSPGLATPGTHQEDPAGVGDAFLLKFAPDGARVWGTYFGGALADGCTAVAVDAAGNATIGGATASESGVATPGAPQEVLSLYNDAFIARFDPSGKLAWGTYFGGTGQDQVHALAYAPNGDVYVGGQVEEAAELFPFPGGSYDDTPNGGWDGFLLKIRADGSVVWATYYGGDSYDSIHSIVADANGLHVAGDTNNADLATVGDTILDGYRDNFVSRFDAAGHPQWTTLFGGDDGEHHPSLAVTPDAIYMASYTRSSGGLATPNAFQKTFGGVIDVALARFSLDGDLVWSTYYGGSEEDTLESDGLVVGPSGDLYFTGHTRSSDNIATKDGLQPTYAGAGDIFVARFTPDNERVWGTYLGGTGVDVSLGGIVLFGDIIYIAGNTNSTAGIAENALFQPSYGGGAKDGFLMSLIEDPNLGAPCRANSECDLGACVAGICCDSPCGNGDPNDCQTCRLAEGASADGTCTLLGGDAVCRPAVEECDAPETCAGDAPACPADLVAADDTLCTDGLCWNGTCLPGAETTTDTTDTTDTTSAPGTGTETTSDDGSTSASTGPDPSTTDAENTSDGPTSTLTGPGPATTGDLSATSSDPSPDPAETPTDAGCACRYNPVSRDISIALFLLFLSRRRPPERGHRGRHGADAP